jgi:hypothetical protein
MINNCVNGVRSYRYTYRIVTCFILVLPKKTG